MSIDADALMNYLLTSFENNEKPEGDWYIEAALRKMNWNGQFDSLKNLDALFASYRKKYPNPNPKTFLSKLSHRNTILLLSAYVGRVLTNLTHSTGTWFDHESFVAVNPTDHQYIPHTFGTSMVLQLGSQWVLPVGLVCDQFFEIGLTQPLSLQVENLILHHQLQHTNNTTAWMHTFQHMVKQQAPLVGGLAYADLIAENQDKWDYSLASLQHLDALLYPIRQSQDFDANKKQLDSSQVNFIFWVGAYLASTVSNVAQCPVYWWNNEEFSAEINQTVPTDINHLRIAQFGEDWHFVLGYIVDYLLGKAPNSLPQYVHSIIKSLNRNSQTALDITQKVPTKPNPQLKNIMLASGLTAAYLLDPISQQEKIQVQSILFDGKTIHHGTIDKQAVEYHWQRNTHKAALLSLGHLTSLHLPTHLLPAIEVKTKINLPDQAEFTISVAFPFYPPQHYQGFKILTPYLLEAPVDLRPQFEALAPYLLHGIKQYEKNHAPFWKNHHIPLDL